MNTDKIVEFISQKANSINGWFYPADMICFWNLAQCQSNFGISGSICEIGVWEGKSLVLLSLLRKTGERLIGYDLFSGNMKDVANSNLQNFGQPENSYLIPVDASKVRTEVLIEQIGTDEDSAIRFLHIDAGHEYHEVLHQLMLYSQFVRSGGIIVLDDYHDREFPGIEAAALDFCAKLSPRRFVPFLVGANKIYLAEQYIASRYQLELLNFEHFKDKSRVSRIRDFNVLVGFSKSPVSAEVCRKEIKRTQFPYLSSFNEDIAADSAELYKEHRFSE